MSESILKLKDFGIGKDVLIVAGGTSVKEFRFNNLRTDIILFGINFQFLNKTIYGKNKILDYLLYTDKSFSDLSPQLDLQTTKLIGHKPTRLNDANLLSEKAAYWFNETIIKTERDSCYYAIQICRDIMKFNEVYIIGLDGYLKNGIIHYWGDKFELNETEYKIHPNEKKMNEMQLERMKKYYCELPDYRNVYNCNQNSLINAFPYKLPWGGDDD